MTHPWGAKAIAEAALLFLNGAGGVWLAVIIAAVLLHAYIRAWGQRKGKA